MANDGGLVAKLEQWLADTLAALTNNSVDVFKTADVWHHQVAATEGGLEASERFSPFAFASYQGGDSAREGDNDLRQILNFAILIGVDSKEDGVARFGDATHLAPAKSATLLLPPLIRSGPMARILPAMNFIIWMKLKSWTSRSVTGFR